jgi:hypothetical protein
MTILDRYLLRELAGAWLIGLAVFVGFLLVGEVLRKSIELLFFPPSTTRRCPPLGFVSAALLGRLEYPNLDSLLSRHDHRAHEP